MAFITNSWDETKPAGTRAPTLGDDDIREFKQQVRERLAVDHDYRSSEAGAESVTVPTGTIGYHVKVTLTERAADPTNVANAGILYTKDDGGDTELYWEDDSGNVKQLTKDGALNIAATEAVLLTGDQTIAGVKTFSSSPIVPTPTTDYQAATKKYMDDNAFTVSDVTGVLGTWASKSQDTVYEAATDGFVTAYCQTNGAASRVILTGYTDSSNPPTTIRAKDAANDQGTDPNENASIMFPVKKGDYWKVTETETWNGGTTYIYWIPLGS